MRLSKEVWDEWLHPCGVEEYRRVVFWNQWSRRDNGVRFGLEEFQVF
jgi:hypothetical protein